MEQQGWSAGPAPTEAWASGAAPPQVNGLITPGNIDLSNRPRVKNADGSVSTVRSLGVNIDGQEVLIPTVVGGRVVSDDEAIAEYKKTGKHLGIFKSPEASTAYAQQLHESEAAKLADEPRPANVADMLAGAGRQSNLQEGGPDWKARLNAALQPYAHPQTTSDIGHLMMAGSNEVQGVVGQALAPVTRTVGRVVGSITPSADTVRRGMATATDLAADVAESPITNIVTPRAKHVGELLRRASEAMRGKPVVGEGPVSAPGYPRYSEAPAPKATAQPSGTTPGASGAAQNVQDTPQGVTSGPEPNAAAAPTSPAGGPSNGLPDQKALNEQALAAARRTSYQESLKAKPADLAAASQQLKQAATAAGKPAYTLDEWIAGSNMVAKGASVEDAMAAIDAQRSFSSKFGLSKPTVDATRFPKGMRGKASGAQQETPAPRADSAAAWNAQNEGRR